MMAQAERCGGSGWHGSSPEHADGGGGRRRSGWRHEPAWHRRARRARSYARVTAALARELVRLSEHHGSAAPYGLTSGREKRSPDFNEKMVSVLAKLGTSQAAIITLLSKMSSRLARLESHGLKSQAEPESKPDVDTRPEYQSGAVGGEPLPGSPAPQRPGVVGLGGGGGGGEVAAQSPQERKSVGEGGGSVAASSRGPSRPTASSSIFPERPIEHTIIGVGTKVRLCGLENISYNDKKGVVIQDRTTTSGRLAVRLEDGQESRVLRDKLVISIF